LESRWRRKNIPVPHIPLKYEEAVKVFLEVKPPKKKRAPKKKPAKERA
jgi:hypothetical protein